MRICHLIYDDVSNPWLGGGGALRAWEIYRRLAGRHQITLVCGNYPGAEREEVVDGVNIVRVGSCGSYAISRLTYCAAAPKVLRQRPWDVWVHEFSAFAPLWIPGPARRRGILFFYHFVGAHALKKHPVVGGVSWAAEFLTLKAYRNILTISPSMRDQVRRRVSPDVQVDCVYSGVDAGCFQLVGAEEPYILYFGRTDVHTKGLDTLVTAFASVAADHPHLRLRMAGRGRQSETERLGRLVAASGAADRIDQLGAVDEERKGELLSNALFVCTPSRYEGWCIAAVEASAAGKAILGTRIDGLRDAVRDGDTGILVESGNPGQLAAGMSRLLADGALRERMGSAGREWARRFDWDRIALDQEQVFLRVAEKNAERASATE